MGDVMFGGRFSGRWVPRDVPAHDPLERVAHLIQSDLAMANLETTVMSEIPELTGDLRFVATPDQVAVLPKNHITAVTLANNHINDVDAAGIAETPGHLAALGLTMIGVPRAEEPVFRVETVEVRGWKIGFVAGTTKLNRVQKKKDPAPKVPFVPDHDDLKDTLVPVITAAKADHDLVIVVLHWGEEYKDEPARWQVKAARAYIDAGADAVIAHHPHVLQGIERYKHGLIAYSLGNFLFDNLGSNRKWSGILHLHFRRDGACLERAAFDPTIGTRPRFHPAPAGKAWDTVAGRIQRLSAKKPLIATEWHVEGERLVVAGACE